MTGPVHGGGLDAAIRRWGQPAEGWLDLSTGINPWPYPLPDLDPTIWQRLPGERATADLLDAARHCYGADPACPIVAASGSQALIGLLPGLFDRPRPVLVVGATYAEHAYRWRLAGHEVRIVDALPDQAIQEIVVLANPNNPDGRIQAPERLAALAHSLGAGGGLLVVDEAFADVMPEISLAGLAGRPGLLILRSFGKFFGLAGLRLGLALGESALIGKLAQALGPWAVSGPALAIGTRALADGVWINGMRQRLIDAGASLDAELHRLGLTLSGGAALFRLVRHPNAVRLVEQLARSGILVRHFSERPDWLRIGLPPDAAASARLCQALGRLTGA